MENPKDSTVGATPSPEKAEQPMAEVGRVRSSEDPVPDLWFGENTGERRDATCSAGEKSREGCGDGPRGLTAPEKVRKLQITLYRKAKASPGYRFWSLYGEVQRADVLREAWRRVKTNGGAPGVDGVTIEDLAEDGQLEAAWLSALREELHRKTYRPAPVRRVYIPKASGGVRPLGIPTVKDRVVQMAVYLVLMAIFEADFHPCSYGFRPKRNAQQAMGEIRRALRTGRTEVVDADLAQYFDSIPHRELLRQVARRVSDGMILKLIKGWLRAPIVEEKEGGGRKMKTNTCGAPQGGVISPLLANIYLHPLDEEMNGQTGGKARMIRYADDLVICCPCGKGEQLKERLTRWLTAKGLALNERKTRIVQSRESGFVFLGFAFRWQESRHGKEYVHVCPSPEAEQSLRDRIREMTHHETAWKDPAELVGEINRVSRGWGQYFAASHHARSFRQLSHFIAERVRRWLRNKHQTEGMYERWPDEVLHETYGLERLQYAWVQPS
jgi:RNA-directed DNA polymerase